MKNLMRNLLLICLFAVSNVFANNPEVTHPQDLVLSTFQQSFPAGTNKISDIMEDLPSPYWKAFACYYEAVYYKVMGENLKTKESLDNGLEIILAADAKDSEYLALEGLLLGFKAGVEPAKAAIWGSKSSGKLKRALKQDDQNLRACLGLAENNFYTPKAYGGWGQAEFLLKKTLACPDATPSNTEQYAPTWGRNRAYALLVSYYKKEGKLDLAKQYCEEGIKLFPKDGELSQLLASL